jgi:serine/threonine-protein kinase HipA
VFHWLTASPDAHAKNYAFVYVGPYPRLAPLFDLTSASLLWLPNQVEFSGRLAMSMGGEFQLFATRRRHLEAAASEIGVEPDWMVAEARRQADGLMTALEAVVVGEPDLDTAVADAFRSGLRSRLKDARRALD